MKVTIPDFDHGLQQASRGFKRIRKSAQNAAIALAFTLIVSGLQFEGIINATLGYICIGLAWIVASALTWSAGNFSRGLRLFFVLCLGVVLLGGNHLLLLVSQTELERYLCPHPLRFTMKESDDSSVEITVKSKWFGRQMSTITVFSRKSNQSAAMVPTSVTQAGIGWMKNGVAFIELVAPTPLSDLKLVEATDPQLVCVNQDR
jgi:hypothetical protein